MENGYNFFKKNDFGGNLIFDYNIDFNDKQINLTDTKNRILYLNILNFNKINHSECTSKWEPYLSNDYQYLSFNYKICYAPPNILQNGDSSWLIVLARKSVYDSRSNKLRSELPDDVLYTQSLQQT